MPETPFTVAELTDTIKGAVEGTFPDLLVRGEVTGFTRAASGHCYFDLKGGGAKLRCVMYRGFALRLKFDARDGVEVVARGGLTVYAQRGEYQLLAQELTPAGVGAAELALRELKEKLLRRGYFAPERKRPLPRFPRRLALVASPTGAAVRDMLELLATRWPAAEVVVRPSRVQGYGAELELAAAVRQLNRCHRDHNLALCAIVLGRGGGSAEDLAAFNTEEIAQAVYDSEVPVVSAVGHEIDVSLADLVADYRALTPSQAITALTPDRAELLDHVRLTESRLRDAIRDRLALARERVDRIGERPAFRRPLERVRALEQRLDQAADRLQRAASLELERRNQQVATVAERLAGLSPLNVLARGYSLTRRAESVHLVRSASELAHGDTVITRLADGEFRAVVTAITPGAG